MMSVMNIINRLEAQNTPEVSEALNDLKELFGPLLDLSYGSINPPVYNMEFDGSVGYEVGTEDTINWEQRRFELVKDLYAAHMQAYPNYNRQGSDAVKNILVSIMRQADIIIDTLK